MEDVFSQKLSFNRFFGINVLEKTFFGEKIFVPHICFILQWFNIDPFFTFSKKGFTNCAIKKKLRDESEKF